MIFKKKSGIAEVKVLVFILLSIESKTCGWPFCANKTLMHIDEID